jgi:hypothetical protein
LNNIHKIRFETNFFSKKCLKTNNQKKAHFNFKFFYIENLMGFSKMFIKKLKFYKVFANILFTKASHCMQLVQTVKKLYISFLFFTFSSILLQNQHKILKIYLIRYLRFYQKFNNCREYNMTKIRKIKELQQFLSFSPKLWITLIISLLRNGITHINIKLKLE